jgi:galactokinase
MDAEAPQRLRAADINHERGLLIEPQDLKDDFQKIYVSAPELFRAPGRVNLIGEHTDYNDGFVMPAAIGFYTWAAVAARTDNMLNVRSTAFDDVLSTDMSQTLAARHLWFDYVLGVVDQLKRAGMRLNGADMLISGDVPLGAGLSSSAAIEVATAVALSSISGENLDRKSLALLCQRAENDFVGMRSGIMDPFISANGRRDHALLLDCRSLDFKLLPLPNKAKIVICNTMIKHQHASGEYNQRRKECEEGVRILSQFLPGIRALRDVSLEDLGNYQDRLSDRIRRRCRHVITENVRVLRAAEMLEQDDLSGFGQLMCESHASLRDDYEVSCRELDIMVELASNLAGVYGARMTGGGFGGCAVALVTFEQADNFRQKIAAGYQQQTGIAPEIYISGAADGAARVC